MLHPGRWQQIHRRRELLVHGGRRARQGAHVLGRQGGRPGSRWGTLGVGHGSRELGTGWEMKILGNLELSLEKCGKNGWNLINWTIGPWVCHKLEFSVWELWFCQTKWADMIEHIKIWIQPNKTSGEMAKEVKVWIATANKNLIADIRSTQPRLTKVLLSKWGSFPL